MQKRKQKSLQQTYNIQVTQKIISLLQFSRYIQGIS